VPNRAKAAAKTAVETARGSVHDAETMLSEAIDDAAGRARRPGSGATATVDPAAGTALAAARDDLAVVADTSRATPSQRFTRAPWGLDRGERLAARTVDWTSLRDLPLHQVRPDARLLDEERKLLTHAIGDGRLQRRVPPSPGCCARTTAGPTTKPAPCSGRSTTNHSKLPRRISATGATAQSVLDSSR